MIGRGRALRPDDCEMALLPAHFKAPAKPAALPYDAPMATLPLQPLVIALTLAAGGVAMALALWASARRQPEPLRAAQLLWARGLAALPLGWVLLELSLATATPSLSVPAKMLFMAAFMEFLRAMRAVDGEHVARFWLWVPVGAVGLLSLGFLASHPSDPMRTGLLSLLCAIAAASTAQSAWRHLRAGGSTQAGVLCLAFVLVAAVLAGRAGLLFLPESAALRTWAETPLAQGLLLGICVLGPAVATLSFVLVGADRLLDRLERIASRDSLTGAASRRAFFELAGARFELARNRRKSLAVIVIDVDRFKSVNDEFGHAGGDLALQGIANALREGLREQDLLGRLGGEEFAALLPDADLALASQVAERLRRAVASLELSSDGRRMSLRICAGVASLAPGDDSLHALLVRADRGLYDAKRAGRDRVGVVV